MLEGALDVDNQANQRPLSEVGISDTQSAPQEVVQQHPRLQTRYGVLLLDGGAVQFSHHSIGSTAAAGSAIAQTLLKSTEDNFGNTYGLRIRVCIYLDLQWLAATYADNGIVQNPDDFIAWAKSFNTASPWAEIYDVGGAKDASKTRVQELLEMHLRDESCCYVIFGGEVDDTVLSIVSQNRDISHPLAFVAGSITKLQQGKSIPAECYVSYDNIFRFEPLEPSAGATRTRAPVQRDEHGRRIDPRICVNQAMISKVSSQKYCNNKYLRGECTYDGCRQNHTAKLSQAEMDTLTFLARCLVCRYGPECTDEDCHAGHICPRSSCNLSCKFPTELHLVGTIQGEHEGTGSSTAAVPVGEQLTMRERGSQKRRRHD